MFLGLDFGTSGARACVIDGKASIVFEARVDYHNAAGQTSDDWQNALHHLLNKLPSQMAGKLQRIAIDGTSASVLLCDEFLNPVNEPLLYHDARSLEQSKFLQTIAPTDHVVCSSSSGLAKFLWLTQHVNLKNARFFLHQADWLSALLTRIGGISDYHNALKTGYDPERMCWPEWVKQLPHTYLLPEVFAPGHKISIIHPDIAQYFHINPACTIHAGTTDSIAAFIAAGANRPGSAVTSLGTTLVIKLLTQKRIENAQYGIYSHRYGNLWLAGGASNAGAGVLKQYFSDEQLTNLSKQINPLIDSPLDYYPLSKNGERFPINDPDLPPRLLPRPASDADFLHGILQGLAKIEAAGYKKLEEMGASKLQIVYSSGGGAKNPAWQQIRESILQVPIKIAAHTEAAYGAALLALQAGISNIARKF